MNTAHARQAFLSAVYDADTQRALAALNQGVDANAADPQTGLTALHIAVGTNNLVLTRILVEEWGAEIKPDRGGRWPTLIAAQCRVDNDLCDYIVQAEAKVLYPK